jgi:hypothetical protein
MPGVHNLSMVADLQERPWEFETDIFPLLGGKRYYIPGNAIVYGQMGNYSDPTVSNIRVYGHGTLSGAKMPHPDDYLGFIEQANDVTNPILNDEGDDRRKKFRMLWLTKADNCSYEGITIADQPYHGIYIEGQDEVGAPNYIKWVKTITWRLNNDGMGVRGNSYIEDCFIRHQDDGTYVRGMGIRRTVYWSDVNGTPLRCSFITIDRGPNYPDGLPQDLIVEDIDIIYARGVYADGNNTTFGVITNGSGSTSVNSPEGTLNTAQHLIFRNITISDPRPTRNLFAFDASTEFSIQVGDWAGIRFENINYIYPQTFGWKNRLLGSADAEIRHWVFKDVYIGGEKLDAALIADGNKFETQNISNLVFK